MSVESSVIRSQLSFYYLDDSLLPKPNSQLIVGSCDPHNEQSCSLNEKCAFSELIQAYECKCKSHKYKRINNVCREYVLQHSRTCQLFLTDECDNSSNEECVSLYDYAKHGTCQCKLGFERDVANGQCLPTLILQSILNENHKTAVVSASTSVQTDKPEIIGLDDQVFGNHRKKYTTVAPLAPGLSDTVSTAATTSDTTTTTKGSSSSVITTTATTTTSTTTDTSSTTSTSTTTELPNTDVIADAGPDQHIYYPTRSVCLNSSLSRTLDKSIINRWEWFKSEQSPAFGHFIEIDGKSTSHNQMACIEGLVEGEYVFIVKVWTTSNKTYSSGSVKVTVHQTNLNDINKITNNRYDNSISLLTNQEFDNRIRLILNTNPLKFSELEKDNLINKLELILQQPPLIVHPQIHITSIDLSYKYDKSGVFLEFYVTDESTKRDRKTIEIQQTTKVVDGDIVMRLLHKAIIENSSKHFLQVNVKEIKQMKCFKNCSNHGYCDQLTYKCVCDPYWMPNLYKYYLLRDLDQTYGNNCEWSTLYVLLGTVLSFFALFMIFYMCISCCCCRRHSHHSPHKVRFEDGEETRRRSCLARLCCCCCDSGIQPKLKINRNTNEAKYSLLESMDDNFKIKGQKSKQERTYGLNSSDDEFNTSTTSVKNRLNKEEDEDVLYENDKFNSNKRNRRLNNNSIV